MGGVELSSSELSDYKKFINEAATPIISAALPTLEQLPNKKLAEIIFEKRIMSRARAMARAKLADKYPDLRANINKQRLYDRYGISEE